MESIKLMKKIILMNEYARALGPFIPMETESDKGSYAVRVKFTLAGEDEYANIYVPSG
jgi:hypothetical protein